MIRKRNVFETCFILFELWHELNESMHESERKFDFGRIVGQKIESISYHANLSDSTFVFFAFLFTIFAKCIIKTGAIQKHRIHVHAAHVTAIKFYSKSIN